MLSLKVGARSSLLSMAQMQEVLNELKAVHPDIHFELIYVETKEDGEGGFA